MKRCPYCGHRCKGRACIYHSDLSSRFGNAMPLDPIAESQLPSAAMRDVVKRKRTTAPDFPATCPRCGTINRRRWTCEDCGTNLYLSAREREAVTAAREREGC